MDKASAPGAGDSRFEAWADHQAFPGGARLQGILAPRPAGLMGQALAPEAGASRFKPRRATRTAMGPGKVGGLEEVIGTCMVMDHI